jgi:hypothetical protein
MGGQYNIQELMRNIYEIFIWKPVREEPLGQHVMQRWNDKNKLYLKGTGFQKMYRIHLIKIVSNGRLS